MKNIIPLIFVIAIYIITPSKSECSTNSFTPVPILNPLGNLGRWFTTSRFSNGDDESICLWEEFTIASISSIHEVLNRLYENGTDGYTKAQQTSTITQVDPPKGIVDVKYSTGFEQIKYITAINYYEYSLVRACTDGEGINSIILIVSNLIILFMS